MNKRMFYNYLRSDYSWNECSNGLTSSVVRRGSPAKSLTRTCDELAKKTLISDQSHSPQGIVYDRANDHLRVLVCPGMVRLLDQWEIFRNRLIRGTDSIHKADLLGNIPTKYGLKYGTVPLF